MDDKASENIVSVEDSDRSTGDVPSTGDTPESQQKVHEDATKQDVSALTGDSSQGKDSAVQSSEEGQQTPSETHESNATTTPVPASSTQNYVPPVKRFSSVNINKKFLQKTQTSPASSTTGSTPASSSGKQAGVLVRPSPQSLPSHSRLVTAKLTASAASTSPVPGWSRPNSVPPPAASPSDASGLPKSGTPSAPGSRGQSQPVPLPGAKLVQPQARNVLRLEGSSAKPAWRNVQPVVGSITAAQNEFPTAAEAAKGISLRIGDDHAASEVLEAHKHAMDETADAFRGVHLDPNAHHWDEMEEDNDDFLGGVIEFGDGRQYTIQASNSMKVDGSLESEAPVSKQERFPDDFDRSWPRSRPDVNTSVHDGPGSRDDLERHSRTSEASAGHSPIFRPDGSRILFNERSNRMERYSGSRNAQGAGQGPPFRRTGPESSESLMNGRVGRDAPPHSHQAPFQVLQKSRDHMNSPEELHHPSLTLEGHRGHGMRESSVASQSPTETTGEHIKGRSEARQPAMAHAGPTTNVLPSARSPSTSREVVNGIAPVDGHSHRHPPMRPHLGMSSAKDAERQLPPHLQHAQDAHSVRSEQSDSRSQRSQSPSSSRQVPVSDAPAEAVKQDAPTKPDHPEASAPTPPVDEEALRKAFIASSVGRARLRRQQEEEERARASERARKKAEELAKQFSKPADIPVGDVLEAEVTTTVLKTESHPTEAEVLTVIEEAIKQAPPSSIEPAPSTTSGRAGIEEGANKPMPNSLFLLKTDDQAVPSSNDTASARRPPIVPIADQKDSWRARAKPPAPTAESASNDFSQDPTQAALPAVQAFTFNPDESMEVIDFSDIGRLVGQKAVATAGSSVPQKPSRPVASDFLDVEPDKRRIDSWRRSDHVPEKTQPISENIEPDSTFSEAPNTLTSEVKPVASPGESDIKAQVAHVHLPARPIPHSHDVNPGYAHHGHPHPPGSPGFSRILRPPHGTYREVPLSALDDTMSRIKGALDGMHSAHEVKTDGGDSFAVPVVSLPTPAHPDPPKQSKWLPPTLRPQDAEERLQPMETFDMTHPEPPRSPPPSDGNYVVRLAKYLRALEPPPKKKLLNFEKFYGPVRWEILSFDPPVEGMTKRALSVNDVLFRKPQGLYKTKRFIVLLPKMSPVPLPLSKSDLQPRVNVLNGRPPKDASIGAFGRPRGADQPSWRVGPPGTSQDNSAVQGKPITLDVTSRSPPPDLVRVVKVEQACSSSEVIIKAPGKAKGPRKSLDRNDVAFYRDLRKTSEEFLEGSNASAVTFTVNSELEGESAQFQSGGSAGQADSPESALHSSSKAENASPTSAANIISLTNYPPPQQPTAVSKLVSPKGLESQVQDQTISDPLLRKTVSTPPPSLPAPVWRSPGRIYPDPEHLKAVWSQASDKESLPTTNSLKNFADDLTAVPFTLLEVKSESGTPPPSGPIAPPTRMSASEVTKAFQTVPSGPSNHVPTPSLRNGQASSVIGSPLAGHRPLKPNAIDLPPSTLQPVLNPTAPRPHYVGYPAMNNHSPSPPTLMYSHVQNGLPSSPAASPYGQPVWMPVVQHGPPIMRAQPASPYSPSLMPYHVTGASQNGVYPPQNGIPSMQGSHAAYPSPRPMMVSPVMPQATPVPSHMMYAGSPMLVPVSSPSGPPQPRPFSGMVVGRPPMPVQTSHDSRPPTSGHPPSTPRFPVHSNGYQPVHAQPFARQW